MSEDRFKISVWDEHLKLMCHEVHIYPDKSCAAAFEEEALTMELQGHPDRFKLMQCTGLKDKNGKLIYEGDIVSGTSAIGRPQQDIVKWQESGFSPWAWFEAGMYLSDLEIIGNIYENPELLEAKDDK